MNYLILLSILPIYLIGYYFYQKDTVKEPKKLLRNLFLSGVLSGIIVIIVTLVINYFFPKFVNTDNLNTFDLFIFSFIVVSLVEECSKFLMIYKISYNSRDFDQYYDIILYSVFVGLGFACFENIIYVLGSKTPFYLAIFRGLTAIPAHACFQTFMGYFLGISKFKGNKKLNICLSLIIPIILHGTYDFLLFKANINTAITFFILLITMFIVTIRRIKDTVEIDKSLLNNRICPNCQIEIKENYCSICGQNKGQNKF